MSNPLNFDQNVFYAYSTNHFLGTSAKQKGKNVTMKSLDITLYVSSISYYTNYIQSH